MLSPIEEFTIKALLHTAETLSLDHEPLDSPYLEGYTDAKVDMIVNCLLLDVCNVGTYKAFNLVRAAVEGNMTSDELINALNDGG